MTTPLRSALVALALTSALATTAAAPALAQEGEEVELGDDPLLDDTGAPGGAEENPDDPVLVGEEKDEPEAAPEKPVDDGEYPIELVQRPLTLFAGMSEVSVDLSATFDPVTVPPVVRSAYGVTDQVQVGLRYGAGALIESEYEVGKAVAIDARYLIKEWVAAELSIPILLDPFAIAIELGAPLKFRLLDDKLALLFGEDLLAIKLHRLIPDAENAAITAAQVAFDDVGTQLADAELRFIGGAIYQWKPNQALTAQTGYIKALDAPDATSSGRVPLFITFTHSLSNQLDVGGRAFILSFDAVSETAGIAGFAQLRI